MLWSKKEARTNDKNYYYNEEYNISKNECAKQTEKLEVITDELLYCSGNNQYKIKKLLDNIARVRKYQEICVKSAMKSYEILENRKFDIEIERYINSRLNLT